MFPWYIRVGKDQRSHQCPSSHAPNAQHSLLIDREAIMTSYLLRGGIVATYTKDNEARAFKADVLVEKSVITQIGEGLTVPNSAEIIDCTNKWITPGFVDTHRYRHLCISFL